ncbi:MAG: hypothetical protein M1823_005179 [Watsoniomyces obsoletus]|nr:MAG: hypothetical protein M1823_005179 [Watsoniomyces obsoletus]
MAEEGEDYSSLPLLDRFTHKIWKVRKQGYEDAAQQFSATADEADPVYKPFLQDPGLWKGAVADSNVAAQQEGIAALCAFLKYAGPQACTRTRQQAIPPLAEKGLSSTRAATKTSSLEALLLYVELDQPGPVVEELLPALSHKQPKIIAAVLNALTSIYHNYGCKTADPKPVLKVLPKVFGHADKNVRAEAQNLAVELYRWLREAMKPVFWNDLKPVQQQDLDALFEKVKHDPPPTQERLLRSQQEAAAAAAAKGGDGDASEAADGGAADDAAEVDTFDLMEPVNVSAKIPSDLFDNLASTKWKDRKESLEALFQVTNVPRIQDSDFNELTRALAKCMKDANIAVVTIAANCVEVLAKGLRHHFSKHRQVVMSPMLERLKEKKQSVTDALGAALDAVVTSTGLSDCLEETLESTKHKNPQVKLESVRLLIRSLRTTRNAPSKAEVKLISEAAIKLLTESSEVLRSAAAEVLGTVMKIMGERAMNPYMDGLDEIRRTKIKEFFEKAEVKAKDKPKPVAPPPAAKTTKPGPGGKKVAGGKPASKAPPPAATDEPTHAPVHPKPTGRSIPAKPGGGTRTVASSGLKMPKKLVGSGGTASTTASPMKQTPARRTSSPIDHEDAAPQPPPAAPKLGLGGRSLVSRPLGKPASSTNGPVESAPSPAPSGLSVVERAELEELRAETQRLQRQNEDLRADRNKLSGQVHDLQNQNAELIEDHTRDVLTIKAKETQLVRARSDAEAAEAQCQKQQREMERLKRELSRAVRAASPGPSEIHGGLDQHIYRDGGGLNGVGGGSSSHHPSATSLYGLNLAAGGGGGGSRPTTRRAPYTTTAATNSVTGDEKENHGSGGGGSHEGIGIDLRHSKFSPSLSSAVSSGTGGGRASPTVGGGGGGVMNTGSATGSGGTTGTTTAANGEGIESWKRAAEVTSALKARIEQMKARQGITKPS